jgi:zeta-carotene desaturase
MNEARHNVLVVGGGLAGIACAVGLAGRGVKVTLLESRHALGGRASSFEDQEREGELLDNCQHVLLGCCTNLLDLYERLGVREKVAFHRRVHFLEEGGRRHDLWGIGRNGGMPAPLHLGPSMAFFSALTLKERAAVVRGMLAMLKLGRKRRDMLEGVAFGEWLDRYRQPASVVKKFYDPIVISALNEETRKASAKYAIQVFQEAMLANARGYVVGLPACPLGELYRKLPEGVEVRVNARVEEVVWEGGKPEAGSRKPEGGGTRAIGVRLRGGDVLRGEAVVLATNHHAVQRWVASLPGETLKRDGRFGGLEKLESVPILGVHLWFDRPVMPPPMASAALIEGPLQWLFRKDEAGRQLHGVISAAREWGSVPKERALAQFEAQLRKLFPAAGDARVERGVIVIEKRATFAPLPGVDRFRPSQAPSAEGIEGLYLAGDYTKTDWPATMEGAARSGYLAAEGVLAGLGMEMKERVVVPDLEVQWPARLMGL